jgi:DNA gyrase subunit A
MRARAAIETHKRGDRQSIIVTEIPYQVNKAKLLERIAGLVREKRIEGVSDLRDESDRDGIRIVIEVKRGEVPEVLLNQLYKLTPMQSTFGIILLAIVDNQPQVLTLKQLLEHFLNHRKRVIIRRTRFDLRKAEERAHLLEGILKALDSLDEVIATIRSSHTPADARERLMAGFALSRVQAQAILDMRLQKLTGLEREKVVEEYRGLMEVIEQLRALLSSDQRVLEEIRQELLAIKQAYGDKRRTEIIPESLDITIEDMIADEDMVITVTRAGYVKRSPLSLYRSQHRGGKGRMGMVTKEGDFVEHLYVASAHSYILVFTESGRAHWLKVHEVPQLGPAARGKAIVNLLQLEKDEKVATTVAVREFPEDRYLVFATEKGTIKKTKLSAYAHPRAGGIIAIRIDDGDRLLDVRETDGRQTILLATTKGYAIHFSEQDARPMGRATRGVRGISLRKGDKVVAMEALDEDGGDVLSLAENAVGKRTPVAQYRLQRRGGKGIINLKISERTGRVIGAKQVRPEDGLMLITQDGKIIRINVDGVRLSGRSTQGVKLMDLGEKDRLVAVAKLAEQEEGEGEGEGEGEDEGVAGVEQTEEGNAEPVN